MIIAIALLAIAGLGLFSYRKKHAPLVWLCLVIWSVPTVMFIGVAIKNGGW